MVPENSSTSLLRWAFPSCRMDGSPSVGKVWMMASQDSTSFSDRGTPSALATCTTSRMAPSMASRAGPGI